MSNEMYKNSLFCEGAHSLLRKDKHRNITIILQIMYLWLLFANGAAYALGPIRAFIYIH